MTIQRTQAICHFFGPIVLLKMLSGCALTAEPHDEPVPDEESVDVAVTSELSTIGPVGRFAHLAAPGYGPVLDFTGDGFADIADHHVQSGHFWVRRGFGNGAFEPPGSAGWGFDITSAGRAFQIVTGDFTGDGYADYADRFRSTGQFWIHENRRTSGSTNAFDDENWAFIITVPDGDWEVLAGRMDGDRFADIVEHNRVDGRLVIRRNGGFKDNGFSQGFFPSFRTQFGAAWRLIIADFNGDNLDDVADYHLASAQYFIHMNTGNFDFAPSASQTRVCPSAARTCMFGDYTGDRVADLADLTVSTGFFQVLQSTFFPIGPGGAYSRGFDVMGLPIQIAP